MLDHEAITQRLMGVGRRNFLGRVAGFGVAAAMASLLAPHDQRAEAATDIKFSHGFGLCNMPLFYSAEKNLFKKYNINISLAMGLMAGDQATQLAAGQTQMAVIPYTNGIAAYSQGGTFQVVAGSGSMGLIVVSQPEIKTWADMKGKKIAAARADTLEIVVYDYLKKVGLSYPKDLTFVPLGDPTETVNAFLAKQVDAISMIEPYATKAKTASGGNILGDGVDLYGQGYSDCVLAASKDLIQKNPQVVKDVIKVFFQAQAMIESNFEEAVKTTVGKYYKTDLKSALAAAQAQPPRVDIRDQRDFMYGRSQSMKELGYISKDPDKDFIDFTLLNQVIKEEPKLYQQVKSKSKM